MYLVSSLPTLLPGYTLNIIEKPEKICPKRVDVPLLSDRKHNVLEKIKLKIHSITLLETVIQVYLRFKLLL